MTLIGSWSKREGQGTKINIRFKWQEVCMCTAWVYIWLWFGGVLFKSRSLKYVWIHIQKFTFQNYTELYFWTQAKNEILYELTKFLESSSLKEGWLLHRREEARDCATRRLRFANDTFCYLGNDHTKIFIDLSDEAWMLPENWVESDDCYLCCLHFLPTDSLIVAALHSANTKTLEGIFLYDIDSTLEAELAS